MRGIAAALACALVAASGSACQAGSSIPTSPTTPTTPTTPSLDAVSVGGTWNGAGSDSFSPELVTWVLTQSGTSVTGTGTLSGTTLSVVMTFPAGGDVPTPICVGDLSGTATVDDRRMIATYTGTDTCEGFVADGKIDLSRD